MSAVDRSADALVGLLDAVERVAQLEKRRVLLEIGRHPGRGAELVALLQIRRDVQFLFAADQIPYLEPKRRPEEFEENEEISQEDERISEHGRRVVSVATCRCEPFG